MTRPLPLAAGAALFAGVLAAQERVPIVGRTLTADGKPWPNAEVVLHAAVHPHFSSLGVVDHVVGRSDAQGRFRIDALAGRSYEAFAREVAADGRHRHAAIAAAVSAAAPVELRDTHGWRAPARLALRGVEAWTAAGPLQLHFAAALQLPPLAIAASGDVSLPALPAPYAQVTLRTATGAFVRQETLSTLVDSSLELVRQSLLVRVLDGPGGKPVTGAAVVAVVDGVAEELGRSDENGYADVMPGSCWHDGVLTSSSVRLCARLAGRVLGLVDVADPQARTDAERQAMRQRGVAQGLATLTPGHEILGTVVLAPQQPARGVTLVVTSAALYQPKPGAVSTTSVTLLHPCGADGSFHLTELMPNSGARLLAVLPAQHTAAGTALATSVMPLLLEPGNRLPVGQATKLAVDLQSVRPLRFEVTGPDGAPALDAEFVLELGSRDLVPLRLRTDRRGHCVLPLPVGGVLRVAIRTPAACWAGAVTALVGDGVQQLPVVLWPRRKVVCTVTGDGVGEGEAVRVDAMLLETEPRWQLPQPEGAAFLAVVSGPPQGPGVQPATGRLEGLVHWLLPEPVAVPAGAGRVELLVPPVPGRWSLIARRGGRGAPTPVAFDAGRDPVEVSIPAPK